MEGSRWNSIGRRAVCIIQVNYESRYGGVKVEYFKKTGSERRDQGVGVQAGQFRE